MTTRSSARQEFCPVTHWLVTLPAHEVARRALTLYLDRFGDAPVLVARAPGRVNLRGMHVDTHGGYLNLMTHQRELVVVIGLNDSTHCRAVNEDSSFPELMFNVDGIPIATGVWESWLTAASKDIDASRLPGWGAYLQGCCARFRFDHPQTSSSGFNLAFASDLPRGAALSSSAAFCVATLLALAAAHNADYSDADLILAARGAEWFAGARTGTSDQAAIVLGQEDSLVNIALFAEDFSINSAQYIPWPVDLSLLVVDSQTTRSLSGAQRVAYTANRFAYSLALEVLRQELHNNGWASTVVADLDRLSRITPELFGDGLQLLRVMKSIPERTTVREFGSRYDVPDLHQKYEELFAGVPPEERPNSFALRAPLLYAISESERARNFSKLLQAHRYEEAGRWMSIGHDADRVSAPAGGISPPAYDDAAFDTLIEEDIPLEHISGYYGASSPALDRIVDAALAHGALGACLTGAGLAGSVLVLSLSEKADALRASLLETLQLPESAIVANRSVAGASLLN